MTITYTILREQPTGLTVKSAFLLLEQAEEQREIELAGLPLADEVETHLGDLNDLWASAAALSDSTADNLDLHELVEKAQTLLAEIETDEGHAANARLALGEANLAQTKQIIDDILQGMIRMMDRQRKIVRAAGVLSKRAFPDNN